MKNDEVIIKEVTIASATGRHDSSHKYSQNTITPATTFEFTAVKTVTCVIDEERSNAIDIETGEKWHLVRRNELGFILPEEFDQILNGKDFALKTKDKEWDKISLLYQLVLKERAKKIFDRYLKSLEPTKVKRIEKSK